MVSKNNVRKKISVCCILALCILAVTGCSGKKDENGSMTAKDGRSYGGEINGKEGEVISTAFFDMVIEDTSKYETFQFEDGLYQPESGSTYLVVTLTIKNTYEKDLPMSITDFTLDYEGAGKKVVTGYGKADLNINDYMDNLFTLKKGESITKKILYTVPDIEKYIISYSEYYEDEFKGNHFVVTIKPKKNSQS
ncbi:MAG: DUF4352 domain-containing protein [Lachnospiraceae bacterium]|nr:DUF4352 domain-containing protein [Lachnospiraceae bacterium]